MDTPRYEICTASAIHIPTELRKQKRWLRWQLVVADDGKPTKKPDCSTREFDRFREFEAEVPAPFERGFATTGDVVLPDGYHLLALDLDACRFPGTNRIVSWAADILSTLNSYAEATPSGTGLRVWVAVRSVPRSVRSKVRIKEAAPPGVDKKPELQIFGLGPAGYVTVSGAALAEYRTIARVESLDWLVDLYSMRMTESEASTVMPVGTGPEPEMLDVLEYVAGQPDGSALIAANWASVVGEESSASEAYYRLCVLALEAARGHGKVAVDFLLHYTAWGQGQVDGSRDPQRYTRRAWVEKELTRIAGKQSAPAADVFTPVTAEELALLDGPKEVPVAGGSLLMPAFEALASCAAQQFLVDGVLPRTGIAQIYGDPGCGKTPMALSLAIKVASGAKTWFGHDIDVSGPVVYIIGEDRNGILNRIKAECRRADLDPQRDLGTNLLVSNRPGNLCDSADMKVWAQSIVKAAPGVKLIVIDTQARNFGDGDENSTQDMNRFVNNVAELARVLECLVLLVHHTGHAEKGRGRGSSAMIGALDAALEVKRTEMRVTAVSKKEKNWAKPEDLVGSLDPVTVGINHKGVPITAITLDDTRPPEVDMDVEVADQEDEKLLRAFVAHVSGISDRDEVAVAVLAGELRASTSRVYKIIKRAIADGLVRQERGRGRGKHLYSVTQAGTKFLQPKGDDE